eukprot:7376563-Prymnesium_polylepis.1
MGEQIHVPQSSLRQLPIRGPARRYNRLRDDLVDGGREASQLCGKPRRQRALTRLLPKPQHVRQGVQRLVHGGYAALDPCLRVVVRCKSGSLGGTDHR